jgi:hypothetical protein
LVENQQEPCRIRQTPVPKLTVGQKGKAPSGDDGSGFDNYSTSCVTCAAAMSDLQTNGIYLSHSPTTKLELALLFHASTSGHYSGVVSKLTSFSTFVSWALPTRSFSLSGKTVLRRVQVARLEKPCLCYRNLVPRNDSPSQSRPVLQVAAHSALLSHPTTKYYLPMFK